MRILMIAGGNGKAEGGVAGIVHNLTRELTNLGHSVTPKFMTDLLPNARWPARFHTVEFAVEIVRHVRKVSCEFDVIHIHAPFGFAYGLARRWRGPSAGPPYVMTMHGLEERRNYAMGREAKKGRADYFRWKNRVWQRVYHMPTYRWSFETADQCVVTNRETKVYLECRYLVPRERVWFISNGVGKEFFQEHSFARGIANRILFVGTWIDHKGIYYLVEAFKKVLVSIPEAQLTVAGTALSEDLVRRYFPPEAQNRLNVKCFVTRGEMPDLYAQHDVFVLPSLMEGMPLALLEAMASGMPVVTTESCGMVDVVEDSHTGLLVPPGDAESLSQAIVRLCRDPDLRVRLGDAARTYMTRHTWSHTAGEHEQVYRLAMGSRLNSK